MRIKRKKKISLLSILIFSMGVLLLGSAILYYKYNKNIIDKRKITKNQIALSKETELRTGPDDIYPEIKLLLAGTILEKYSESNEWIEVRTADNLIGWVAGWNVSGSQIKSPEEKMKEKLSNYSVLLNPLVVDTEKDYNLETANKLKEELEKLGIKVHISRMDNNEAKEENKLKLINDNNISLVLNINIYNNDQANSGVSLNYGKQISRLLSKYIEKNLNSNYVLNVNTSEKNDILVNQLKDEVPEVLISAGNLKNKIDLDILNNEIYKNDYVMAITRGVEEYLYYLISVDNYNEKVREELINAPHRGMNIPFYYSKNDDVKDISYGTDNNKKISENGDAIIALAMIEHYLNPYSSLSIKEIVDWAGDKYYVSGQGTSEKIVKNFADKYNLKVNDVRKNQFNKIDEALKDNKPVLIQTRKGSFKLDRPSFKVIRGLEDGKYYLNDPADDDIKLNTYRGFSKEEIEKATTQIWIIYK
ncbi:N-acetylmuramoyl-L-alanine amidase [Gemella sp. zg-1178]|uniref:N-acetylmuramoyl-L-alanine amidase n=1 Tax=Gemella sp. zg-1178 TaxID=2840372 RepID=UPI001C046323|nr:N-acetylmuramoyl-L-alanine amidase [Gemella sp. zg-1178]MBU0278254.1 N-acetylmuramoyl-L-alanine amidase [Gemella sp. zg-1178]